VSSPSQELTLLQWLLVISSFVTAFVACAVSYPIFSTFLERKKNQKIVRRLRDYAKGLGNFVSGNVEGLPPGTYYTADTAATKKYFTDDELYICRDLGVLYTHVTDRLCHVRM
jgi:hypothetical protein